MTAIGRRTWAIAGGHIPLLSTGPEPEYTSRDELCVLNSGPDDAQLEITVYYGDRDPVGPYRLKVPAQRVRQLRFNDLIDPQAFPLDAPFGAVIRSTVPVVVQFQRLGTSPARGSMLGLIGFEGDE